MANAIEHIVEPTRLLLAWQSIDDTKSRTRYAVGELSRTPESAFRYFSAEEFREVNGTDIETIRKMGYVQYPAFAIGQARHAQGVVEAFMRRLPPRSRKDFEQYSQHFRLQNTPSLSDFALLALTEAKLPSDGFSFVDPLDNTWDRRELLIEAAGYRHYSHQGDLRNAIGDEITLEAEPTNPVDPNAVVMKYGSRTVGYVNRFQCRAFHVWLREQRVSATIERLNGEPGRPRLYVFIKVAAKAGMIAA